jgi:hypothetical protein
LRGLVRYVHLNPVRAALVEGPEAYQWSGHRAYLGLDTLPWLTTESVLGHFAKRRATRRQRYAAFVAAGMGEGHRDHFHRGADDARILVDDELTKQVLNRPPPVGPPPTLAASASTTTSPRPSSTACPAPTMCRESGESWAGSRSQPARRPCIRWLTAFSATPRR